MLSWDGTGLGIAVAAAFALPLLRYVVGGAKEGLFYPSIMAYKMAPASLRQKSAFIPEALIWLSLFSFLVAMSDLHLSEKRAERRRAMLPPTEGRAIYLVVDRSGSMARQGTFQDQWGLPVVDSKMDILKKALKTFIENYPDDLIGIVAFARLPQVIAPLTLDHTALLQQLESIQPVQDKEDDGTAIGYAIYKTVSLITALRFFIAEADKEKKDSAYEIKDAAIILVTDGLQNPNPLDKSSTWRNIDVDEAASWAKEQRVRLFILNVEPRLESEELALHKKQMEEAAKLSGGSLFIAGKGDIDSALKRELAQMEKSLVPLQKAPEGYGATIRTFSFYPYLIALGMLTLLASIVTSTFPYRRGL